LKALEALVARNDMIITETQIIAVEVKKEKQEAYGNLKPNIPVTWLLKIHFMSEPLRAWDAAINKRLSILRRGFRCLVLPESSIWLICKKYELYNN